MSIAYALIFGTIVVMSLSAITAFAWAASTGQFHNFQQGATSIFDPDEPLGQMTDSFPGQRPPPRRAAQEPPGHD